MMDSTKKISFCATYNFVPLKVFEATKNGARIDFGYGVADLVKAENLWTEEIRTCVGGGMSNPKEGAVGIHKLDCLGNFFDADNIVEELAKKINDPKSIFLIGSKNLPDNPYSRKIFKRIKKCLLKKYKNITVFDQHIKMFSESHFAYNISTDTWTINTRWRRGNILRDVKSLKDLKILFRSISIAPTDILQINGKRILPKDAPKIFSNT